MIDWDNAPEGATHASWDGCILMWYRKHNDVWEVYNDNDYEWEKSLNDNWWFATLSPRPVATHIEISTGKEWEMVYQSSESCMLTDRNGSAYSLVDRNLSQYFTPIGDDTRELTERERFDAVMTRSDWSGFDKDQRGVLWEMWKEALGM